MSMVDLKNRAVAELLERESRLLPDKHLENYEPQWVFVDEGSLECSSSDASSDCYVNFGKAPLTIKILYKEKNGNGFVTVYDQALPGELLQKLQKASLPSAEAIAMANLNTAARELVEEGLQGDIVLAAKLRVAQDISCDCELDTSVEGLKKTLLQVAGRRFF